MDDGAFGAGLSKERQFLVNLARKKFRMSSDDAEDSAQQAILQAWQNRGNYVEDGMLRAWLVVIMSNLVMSQKRRAWRLTFTDDQLVLDSRGGMSGGQFENVYLRQVLRAMLGLPLEQLDAIMQVARGWQYEDAADNTDAACGTVKSRVARGRQALREALE